MNFDQASLRSDEKIDLRIMKLDLDKTPLREYEDLEFVSELFGKPVIDILDKLYNIHNIVFYRILDGLHQFLNINTTMEPSKKEQIVEKDFPHFEQFVEVSVDRIFNIFQQYFFDNILFIPDDPLIVWDHYKDLNMKVTDDDMDELDEELKMAQNQVIAELAFKRWITNEEKLAEKIVQLEQECYKELEFMKECNDPNLDDHVQRIISNFEELENKMQRRQDEVYKQGTLFISYTMESKDIVD